MSRQISILPWLDTSSNISVSIDSLPMKRVQKCRAATPFPLMIVDCVTWTIWTNKLFSCKYFWFSVFWSLSEMSWWKCCLSCQQEFTAVSVQEHPFVKAFNDTRINNSEEGQKKKFWEFFPLRGGGGHLFPKVYVRIVTKKWTFWWRPKMLQRT